MSLFCEKIYLSHIYFIASWEFFEEQKLHLELFSLLILTSGATSGNAIFLHNSSEAFFYQIHAQIMAFKWHLVLEIIKCFFLRNSSDAFFLSNSCSNHSKIMAFSICNYNLICMPAFVRHFLTLRYGNLPRFYIDILENI